jgi:sialidase-1
MRILPMFHLLHGKYMFIGRSLILSFLTIWAVAIPGIAMSDSSTKPAAPDASTPPGIEPITLYKEAEGGYSIYRIPALIVTDRGTVLAFCEGRRTARGPRNDSGEINTVLRRSTNNGKTFSPLQVVWADGPNTCGNPCPVIDHRTGAIVLLLTHNVGEDLEDALVNGTGKGTRTVWITSSSDDGLTWAPPREITASTKKPEWAWYATGPGIGIQIQHGPHAGRLVIPCDYVAKGGGGATNANAHVIYSDDDGKTWAIGGEPTNPGFNESQIVERDDGSLILNMRRLGKEKLPAGRGVAISTDGGQTFGPGNDDPVLTDAHCEASILRYSWATDGQSRILFSNPAAPGEGAASRKMMTVRLSTDDGSTWPAKKLIYPGWTGYSCLAKLPDGSIGLLYEAGNDQRYERIDFARFSLDWVTSQETATR